MLAPTEVLENSTQSVRPAEGSVDYPAVVDVRDSGGGSAVGRPGGRTVTFRHDLAGGRPADSRRPQGATWVT